MHIFQARTLKKDNEQIDARKSGATKLALHEVAIPHRPHRPHWNRETEILRQETVRLRISEQGDHDTLDDELTGRNQIGIKFVLRLQIGFASIHNIALQGRLAVD